MTKRSEIPSTLYTAGTAPFKGGPSTLRGYIKSGKLGEVPRLTNGTPILYPEHVDQANQILKQNRRG